MWTPCVQKYALDQHDHLVLEFLWSSALATHTHLQTTTRGHTLDQVWPRAFVKRMEASRRRPYSRSKATAAAANTKDANYTPAWHHGEHREHVGTWAMRTLPTTCLSPRSPHARPGPILPIPDYRYPVPDTHCWYPHYPARPVPSQDRGDPARPVPRWEAFSVALPLPLLVQTASHNVLPCKQRTFPSVAMHCFPSCDDPTLFVLQLKTLIGLPPFATGRSIGRSVGQSVSQSITGGAVVVAIVWVNVT